MIKDMTTVAIILIVLAVAAVYGVALARFIAGDGHWYRAASGLPRSHPKEPFEPRSLVS
jgi:hypothetical protein